MVTRPHAAATAALALLVAACSPQGAPRDPAEAAGNATDAEVAAVINLQDSTEIEVLKNRVVTLEREVGELKANTQQLDLELLTQRVQQLEAANPAADATAPDTPRPSTPTADPERAQRAVDAAITERRARREVRD